MTDSDLMAVHILVRKRYNLLSETLELSKQIGESMDRKDQVTMVKFLEERHESLRQLAILKAEVQTIMEGETAANRRHLKSILAGKAFETPKEEALMKQAIAATDLLKQVIQYDKRINTRIAGKDSMYNRR